MKKMMIAVTAAVVLAANLCWAAESPKMKMATATDEDGHGDSRRHHDA